MSCSELMGDDRKLNSRSGWNGNLWAWEHSGDSGTSFGGVPSGSERALRDQGGSGKHLWEIWGEDTGF